MRTTVPYGTAFFWGCAAATSGGGDVAPPIAPDAAPPACVGDDTYPAPTVEPMAMGEILFPYSWPTAIHRGTGLDTALDLADVPCALDALVDWSPFDVLLFVAIPAW
jgi:hypothetical protein